jgi:hypothetical protein
MRIGFNLVRTGFNVATTGLNPVQTGINLAKAGVTPLKIRWAASSETKMRFGAIKTGLDL